MRRVFASKTFLGIMLVLGSLEAVLAQQGTEPLGGQPPRGARASVTDLDYQLKYQRAFEATLWAIPAAAIYRFRGAAFDDLGLKDNDIIAYSAPGPTDDLNKRIFKMPDFELAT